MSLKHMLTGQDNETTDIGRVALLLGIASLIAFNAWDMYLNRPFNSTNYGIAFGSICAAVGVNLWLKKDTEPVKKV